MMLAVYTELPHNGCAADTNAAWFSSQNVPGRTTASRRYFYVRTQLRAFFGRAIAGRAHALPVPLDAGLLTLLSARPPHLAVGSGSNPSKEAVMADHPSRTPAQKLPSSLDLERRCAQMASLTLLLYGNGHAAFNELFEHDRDNILWLVSDLAAEIRDMVNGGAR